MVRLMYALFIALITWCVRHIANLVYYNTENWDFTDTTEAQVKVEVVGGLCDYMLGNSQVKYTIAGCDAWNNLPVMETKSSCFTVPAFPLEFEIACTYSLSITFLRCPSKFHGLMV